MLLISKGKFKIYLPFICYYGISNDLIPIFTSETYFSFATCMFVNSSFNMYFLCLNHKKQLFKLIELINSRK